MNTLGKFWIVSDGWNKADVLSSAESREKAVEWARGWAQRNPGKTCIVLERIRTVASDALREVEG